METLKHDHKERDGERSYKGEENKLSEIAMFRLSRKKKGLQAGSEIGRAHV